MPSTVAAALDASAGLTVSEINGTLTVTGQLSHPALAAWREVAKACAIDHCRLTAETSSTRFMICA